jgi:two-component system response regulator FixJ
MPRLSKTAARQKDQHTPPMIPMTEARDEIFVIDDDQAVRDAMELFLTLAGFKVTTFADGRSAIDAVRETSPACILLDLYLSNESGLDVLTQLDARNFAAPILILSGRNDIPTVVDAVKHGAFDFLEKQLDAETIVERVRTTIDAWPSHRHNGDKGAVSWLGIPGCKPLTAREHEVLSHIAAGRTSREAAATLGISHRTVELHRARIMRKLGASNSIDLVRKALRFGLKPH